METPNVKFLVSTLFVFASAYYVQAGMHSTISKAEVSKVDGRYIENMEISVEGDTMLNAVFTVKDCVTTPVKMGCKLSANNAPLSSSENTYKHPIEEMQEAGLCSTFEPEGVQDSDCAVEKGPQIVKQCDLSKVLEQLPEGKININCDFVVGMGTTAFQVNLDCVNENQ